MFTQQEILSQATQMIATNDAVKKANVQKVTASQAIFTGCGTSYYLAIAAARYFQQKTGIASQAVPASDIFLHPNMYFSDDYSYTLFSFSRSGSTTEIAIALDSIAERSNIHKIAFTCFHDTPIKEKSDEAIVLDHISEKSVVMTQSFSNMLYAFQCYTTYAYGLDEQVLQDVQQSVAKQLTAHSNVPIDVAVNKQFSQFIFLGSGIYNGLAKEATLKLKEMTQTVCESYSSLEFRHGPISIVNEETCVVLLAQKDVADYEKTLVRNIQKFGGTVVAIGEHADELAPNVVISLQSTLADDDRFVTYMPFLQLLAYDRAVALQLDPDKPKNLTQIVTL